MTTLPTPASVFAIDGQSALITGATGAFGEQAAYALAGAGAHVTLAGGNKEGLERVAQNVRDGGGTASVVALRPKGEREVDDIVSTAISAGGGLDILVVGQGMNHAAFITDQDPVKFDEVLDVNVRQVWLTCRAVGRVMVPQKRGKVLLMSSTRAQHGMASFSAYCPAKAAIDALVRTLAVEWGPHGINVNAIAPTIFRSDITEWLFEESGRGADIRKAVLSRIPLGRLGEPTDFHGMVQLLCSGAASFMTGAVVSIDGGYHAS